MENSSARRLDTRSMILCSLFSALIAVGAFIQIPLPTSVPITLQTLFVTLAGLLLGPRLGSLSVSVYLFIGLVGIPVFTRGGGISYVLQPTFGFLLGFVLGAFLMGWLAQKRPTSLPWLFLSCMAGIVVIYAFGSCYFYLLAKYYMHSPIGVKALLMGYVIPFIPKDMASCFLGCLLAKKLWPIVLAKKVPAASPIS